jgi:type I restriction enzyme M protein
MINRRQKELTDDDIAYIGEIYHSWRSKEWESKYKDVPGLCQSVPLDIVRKNNFVLTPGRYIDFKDEEDDGEVFEEKMKKLTSDLKKQMAKGSELDTLIRENLNTLGYEI